MSRVAGVVVALAASSSTVSCSSTPDRSVIAFCTQVRPLKDFDRVLAGGDGERINPQLEQLRQLQLVSPSEIEPQVAQLVSFTDDLARTIATTKDPIAAADETAHRHADELRSIAEAGKAVESYTFVNCGIALSPSAGSSVPGTIAPPGSSPTATTRS